MKRIQCSISWIWRSVSRVQHEVVPLHLGLDVLGREVGAEPGQADRAGGEPLDDLGVEDQPPAHHWLALAHRVEPQHVPPGEPVLAARTGAAPPSGRRGRCPPARTGPSRRSAARRDVARRARRRTPAGRRPRVGSGRSVGPRSRGARAARVPGVRAGARRATARGLRSGGRTRLGPTGTNRATAPAGPGTPRAGRRSLTQAE